MHWTRLFQRKRHADLDAEIESHLTMAIRDRIARGQSPEQARADAIREFGNVGLVKETTRTVWVGTALEQLGQDFRSATRILTKSPGLSVAAITLVALGIGWNATIYSMIHGILTKPAPGIQADRLVSFGVAIRGEVEDPEESFPNYQDYLAQTKTFRSILAFQFEPFTLVLKDASYKLHGGAVTANYFETLGVPVVKGRSFTDAEAGLVAVIAYPLWQNQFHGAEDAIGQTVAVNGIAATIIGVAAPGFRGTWMTADLDFWVPLLSYSKIPVVARELNDRSRLSLGIIGRLKPGASLAQAQVEIDTISKRLQASYPDTNKDKTAVLAPYTATAFWPIGGKLGRMGMTIVTAVAIITLLIVCANVANLMLARAVVRQREMAVRQSIGASRFRVVRMLLAEGLVLSSTALLAAWIFAWWATRIIGKSIPPNSRGVRIQVDFTPDWQVAGYAMALAVLSALAFTLAPTARAWKQELLPWLKAGERSVAQGRSKVANVLVITQLALCVVLLTSAGLAYRSVSTAVNLDLRFAKDHLLLASVDTKGAVTGKEQNIELLERLRKRLLRVRGVVSASYAEGAPPRDAWRGPVEAIGSGEAVASDANVVGPDYLQTLGVPNVRGRGIVEADLSSANLSAVVNQNLANALWPGQSALGRTLLMGPEKHAVEVVGVAPNGFFSGVGRDLEDGRRQNFMFLAERRASSEPGEREFHLRYSGRLEVIGPAVRAAIREVGARVPVAYVRTMETHLMEFVSPGLLLMTLLGLFSIGALLLAAIGLYAVVAFHTARRTRDFGIRMALGASPRQILNKVVKEGLILTVLGVGIGLALSAAAGRAFRSLLFGVNPTDEPTYLAVITVLGIVSLFACYVPARRAARTDPTVALREE
jgi:macrolide transport system ATP-binding/permease protein